MKIKQNGFVIYEKTSYDDSPEYTFKAYKYDDVSEHRVMATVCPCEVEFEVPDDFDPRPQAVKALEAKKQELRAELGRQLMQIDQQISNLLCIENSTEPA